MLIDTNNIAVEINYAEEILKLKKRFERNYFGSLLSNFRNSGHR